MILSYSKMTIYCMLAVGWQDGGGPVQPGPAVAPRVTVMSGQVTQVMLERDMS